MTSERNFAVGLAGERLVIREAVRLFGEAVEHVGVGRGRREPVDLEGATCVVEVKSLRVGGEAKVRPSADSTRRKRAYAQARGKRGITVVVMVDELRGTATVYRAEGFHANRIGGMEAVGLFAIGSDV